MNQVGVADGLHIPDALNLTLQEAHSLTAAVHMGHVGHPVLTAEPEDALVGYFEGDPEDGLADGPENGLGDVLESGFVDVPADVLVDVPVGAPGVVLVNVLVDVPEDVQEGDLEDGLGDGLGDGPEHDWEDVPAREPEDVPGCGPTGEGGLEGVTAAGEPEGGSEGGSEGGPEDGDLERGRGAEHSEVAPEAGVSLATHALVLPIPR